MSRGAREPYHPSPQWDGQPGDRRPRRRGRGRHVRGPDRRPAAGRRRRPDLLHARSARQLVDALRPTRPLLLHCGTIWVHGPALRVPVTEDEPRTAYGEYGTGKAAIEALLHRETLAGGVPSVVLHPGHISGPGWPVITPAGNLDPEVWRRLATGEPLALPDLGLGVLHHVHADDVAQAFERALSRPAAIGASFHVVAEQAMTCAGWRRGSRRGSAASPCSTSSTGPEFERRAGAEHAADDPGARRAQHRGEHRPGPHGPRLLAAVQHARGAARGADRPGRQRPGRRGRPGLLTARLLEARTAAAWLAVTEWVMQAAVEYVQQEAAAWRRSRAARRRAASALCGYVLGAMVITVPRTGRRRPGARARPGPDDVRGPEHRSPGRGVGQDHAVEERDPDRYRRVVQADEGGHIRPRAKGPVDPGERSRPRCPAGLPAPAVRDHQGGLRVLRHVGGRHAVAQVGRVAGPGDEGARSSSLPGRRCTGTGSSQDVPQRGVLVRVPGVGQVPGDDHSPAAARSPARGQRVSQPGRGPAARAAWPGGRHSDERSACADVTNHVRAAGAAGRRGGAGA